MVQNSNLGILDYKVLEELKNNSRISYVAIAKKLGISEAGVRKIVKKLEKLGIIRKYTIEIDYKKLGYKIAIIGLDIDSDKIIHVISKLKNLNNVENIYLSYGDHDIMIEYIYKSDEELSNFIKKLEKIEGVSKVCPAILLERV